MKKFFQYVWQCIRSINFYKDTIINETLGGTFKYLVGLVLLLSFIFVISATIGMRSEFNAAYDEFYNEVDENFYVKMENGALDMNIKQPYIYYDKNFALIIDTTGRPHDLPEFHEGLLIKRWDLKFKNEGKEYNINYRNSEINDFNFDKEEAFNLLAIIKRVALVILPVFVFLGAFIFGFIGKLIYLSIITFLTWLIAAIMKVKDIGYQKSFTLTVFAATGPFLVRDMFEHLGFQFPGFRLIYYIIFITYIVLALRVIKKVEA